ncbi:hypothetical protein F5148DRAFT_1282768 [Russula earlei]|uniref:Uncharacterized protein n=1 Tax=Russula earlei TaxID=71964 RepID=A0ACC0UDK3_9AGAM|nr:hypothetical protein F5148DRAFT_1282768 [Russula earlei]
MSTTQNSVWKQREAGEEAQYARQKVKQQILTTRRPIMSLSSLEQEQLAYLRAQHDAKSEQSSSGGIAREDRDYEAGFGGQEDLEDRYATTSGEH